MISRFAVLACCSLMLVACGGSPGTTLPPEMPKAGVSGVCHDGRILNGVVTIYSFRDGQRGVVLGSAYTDLQGRYSISVQAENQPILIAVTSGRYIEEASGRNVLMQEGQALYAVQNFVMGQPVVANLTYYTTLATGYAEHLIRQGRSISVAIDQANGLFANLLAFSVLRTEPKDITDVANAAPSPAPENEYGFYTAAVSGWTLYASQQNGTADHAVHNSIAFAQLAYDDIRSDGILDGVSSRGRLSVGTLSLSAHVYRHELALQVLRVANSQVNRTGITAAQLIGSARRVNDSTASIFGDEPVVPISDGPTVSNLSIANGAAVSRTIVFSAQVTGLVPVTAVELIVDSRVPASGNPASPSFTVDTTSLSDGLHRFTIRATDMTGQSETASIDVLVDNTPPRVYNRTQCCGDTFYGVYEEAGSGISDITIVWSDGARVRASVSPTSSTGGTWSVPMRYSLSWYPTATDVAGNRCAPNSSLNCE